MNKWNHQFTNCNEPANDVNEKTSYKVCITYLLNNVSFLISLYQPAIQNMGDKICIAIFVDMLQN